MILLLLSPLPCRAENENTTTTDVGDVVAGAAGIFSALTVLAFAWKSIQDLQAQLDVMAQKLATLQQQIAAVNATLTRKLSSLVSSFNASLAELKEDVRALDCYFLLNFVL